VIDLANALEALAAAGLRVPIDLDSALVTVGPDGARGLVDPLRAGDAGESQIADADTASSARELADLLGAISKTPSPALETVVAAGRSGEFARPSELALALGAVARPAAPSGVQRHRGAALVGGGIVVIAAVAAIYALTRNDGPSRTPAPQPV
jgi:hypothetical protein